MIKKINTKAIKLIKFYNFINYNLIYNNKAINRYKKDVFEISDDKAKKLEKLKKSISNIKNCELKKSATNIVFADGNPKAKIMLIGEGPGSNEDLEGLPFVGRAGALLDKMLASIDLNRKNSDIISFHMYELDKLEPTINELKESNRPIFCTEYMARHFGTTFEASLPIFKKNHIACYNWGLVAGKSQTHFGWETIIEMEKKKKENQYLKAQDPIPEPDLWFHDIFRIDGTPFEPKEIEFIKSFLK